jgi:cytochrome c oxidase cbb3-type subunit III
MQKAHSSTGIGVLLVLLLSSFGCEREDRRYREPPPAASRVNSITMSSLQPGSQIPPRGTKNPYEDNAWAVSEGKRLYSWFNCIGCHAHGGGDIGPPLMDDQWVYGSDPENIFATIVEGRPNGMPSFRGKIPDQQVWQLVAYVRSLSGQVQKDVTQGREDDMSAKQQEQSKSKEKPVDAGKPPSTQQTQ